MNRELQIPASLVRGFNYQPTYASCSFETWRNFDGDVLERELKLGKLYFPGVNAIRIWLSWDAWCRNPAKFIHDVGEALKICANSKMKAILCLFNRWHDPMVDCDGIYIDHFLPGSSWLLKYGAPWMLYIEQLAKAFRGSNEILVWDLCNEPFAYGKEFKLEAEVRAAERDWLKDVRDCIGQFDLVQPIGISTLSEQDDPLIEPLVDVYLTHLYFIPCYMSLQSYSDRISRIGERNRTSAKQTFTTETCWGSLDDLKRTEIVSETLATLAKNRIGFVAHALWESDVADLHPGEAGRCSPEIGNLAFIRRDGSLRAGHEAFNQF